MINEKAAENADIPSSAGETLVRCRTDLEILYNLQYLFRFDSENDANRRLYTEMLLAQVKKMDDLICGKIHAASGT
jgi:hypothetical protein